MGEVGGEAKFLFGEVGGETGFWGEVGGDGGPVSSSLVELISKQEQKLKITITILVKPKARPNNRCAIAFINSRQLCSHILHILFFCSSLINVTVQRER